ELQGFQVLDLLFALRLERIEDRLVAAGGIDAPLDADLLEHFREAETARDDADGADDRSRVGKDLVAGERDHVAARGSDILDEDQHMLVLLSRKITDALEDQP